MFGSNRTSARVRKTPDASSSPLSSSLPPAPLHVPAKKGGHRGDLHVALVGVRGLGVTSVCCKVLVEGSDSALFETPWSIKADQPSWSDPQVAVAPCMGEISGNIIIQVSTPGKGLSKKTRFGEARLSIADAVKQSSSKWLDIDVYGGGGGGGGASSESLSRGSAARITRGMLSAVGSPQILVKLLFVSSRSAANTSQFVERRHAVLSLPLPNVTEAVKDLKSNPPSAAGAASDGGGASPGGWLGRRRDSVLFAKESNKALKRVTSGGRREPPAFQRPVGVSKSPKSPRMVENKKVPATAKAHATRASSEGDGYDDGDRIGAYRAFEEVPSERAPSPPSGSNFGSLVDDDEPGGGYTRDDAAMRAAPMFSPPPIRSHSTEDEVEEMGGGYTRDDPSRLASRESGAADYLEEGGDSAILTPSPQQGSSIQEDSNDDDDDDDVGAYKQVVNAELEAEMDAVVKSTLPVVLRGRAPSMKLKPSEQWQDMDSFNSRFQQAVEIMNMHSAQSNTRRMELINSCLTVIRLAQDFATLASQYGKTIISEHALPPSKQTIKPRTELGGVLGGQKYIVLGILFKFAGDEKGLFRNLPDPLEAANKIAGLELKGLKCYFATRTPNLSYPLMALIDYKGYRLVAMSVLPIDKTTLKYGSMDAGRTILHENEDLTLLINEASKQLNLKPHMVGPRGNEVEVVSAADLEGHVGHDGRFYMLDFSRAMPPVYSGVKDRPDYLYQQFRPEFLRAFVTGPLSPDACSNFGRHNAALHDKDIVEATQYLKEIHIPEVTRKLLEEEDLITDPSSFSLSEALHRRGVNMRYLGLVFHNVRLLKSSSIMMQLIIVEMCARVLKNKLRSSFRTVLKGLKDPSEALFNDLVMEEYNTIFGQNVGTHDVWNEFVPRKLYENFSVCKEDLPDSLHDYMRKVSFKGLSGKWYLMVRVNSMTGIEIDPAVMEQLMIEPKMFERSEVLDYLDVIALKERVKPLNIINHAKGEFYYMKGLMRHNHSSSIEYFLKAESCLEDVLHSSPTDPQLLSTMGNILLEHAKKLAMVNPDDPQVMVHLQRGKQYFLTAIRYDDHNFLIFRDYAIFLEYMDDLEGAEDYYIRSLSINPNQMECLRRYGAFLRTFRGEPDEAARFFDRYKMICEQFADGLSEVSSSPRPISMASFLSNVSSQSSPTPPRVAGTGRPSPPSNVPLSKSPVPGKSPRSPPSQRAPSPPPQRGGATEEMGNSKGALPRFSIHRQNSKAGGATAVPGSK